MEEGEKEGKKGRESKGKAEGRNRRRRERKGKARGKRYGVIGVHNVFLKTLLRYGGP